MEDKGELLSYDGFYYDFFFGNFLIRLWDLGN